MKQETVELIYEICKELNIKIEELSYGWIYKLTKDGKIRYIGRKSFDINNVESSTIASDKYATYEVLKSQNIPIIEHKIIFDPEKRKDYMSKKEIIDIISSEFMKNGKIVVKPNTGETGKDVFRCYSVKEIEKIVKELLKNNSSISICPYYDIKNEYRVFYLRGEVLLIYKKIKPFVIGDGKSSLKELVSKLNLPKNDVVEENLSKLDLNYIPENKEKIELSWKHNLSGGATPKIIEKEDKIYKKVEKLAIKTGKTLNMLFATVDIIETNNDNFYVLEVNSGIGATLFSKLAPNGKSIVKDMYKKALVEFFR